MLAAHRAAVTALRALAAHPDAPLLSFEQLGLDNGWTVVRLRLDTRELRSIGDAAAGLGRRATLGVEDEESVVVALPSSFPWSPPTVIVEHDRFVGFSHVLEGRRLCLFLDPTQEWHPRLGIVGFLNRLWDWFHEAATGGFDPRWALFHPVGGVAVRTAGAPTVVVRHPLSHKGPGMSIMALRTRTDHRVDLLPMTGPASDTDVDREATTRTRALVVGLHGALSYGPGLTLNQLLGRIRALDHLDPAAILQALGAAAHRNPEGTELYVVLAVPAASCDLDVPTHLVAARLPSRVATALDGAS